MDHHIQIQFPMWSLFWMGLSSMLFIGFFIDLRFRLWGNSERNLPVFGNPGGLDYRAAMNEGNEKYPDQPFLIPFRDPTVILPRSCIDVIKNLPDTSLSTNGNMNRRFAIGWTGTGWVGPELHSSIKVNLTHEINTLIPLVQEEIKYGIESSIGRLEKWTSLNLMMHLGPVINQVTGRVLVGQPLSRDPKWVGTTMQHVMGVMKFSDRLRTFPTIFRPIVGRFLPELGMVRQTKKSISSMLKTAMAHQTNTSTRKEVATGSDSSNSSESMRLASWLSEKYATNQSPEKSADLIVRDYSTLFMAATGFPVLAITHILIDLAAYPEYLAPLRAEIDGQLKISTSGILDAKGVAKLTLLDSVCKESSRMNPPGIVAWLRMTHKRLTLPTGDTIPRNTLVAMCNPRFNKTSPVFKDSDTFNGARYVNLEGLGQNAFSATSPDDMTFGYGAHACPGRQFASAELKLVVAKLIMDYDFNFEDATITRRPENIFVDFMTMPPPVNLLFKSR